MYARQHSPALRVPNPCRPMDTYRRFEFSLRDNALY